MESLLPSALFIAVVAMLIISTLGFAVTMVMFEGEAKNEEKRTWSSADKYARRALRWGYAIALAMCLLLASSRFDSSADHLAFLGVTVVVGIGLLGLYAVRLVADHRLRNGQATWHDGTNHSNS